MDTAAAPGVIDSAAALFDSPATFIGGAAGSEGVDTLVTVMDRLLFFVGKLLDADGGGTRLPWGASSEEETGSSESDEEDDDEDHASTRSLPGSALVICKGCIAALLLLGIAKRSGARLSVAWAATLHRWASAPDPSELST